MLRMARDLVAKRAVERYLRRKARGSRRGPFDRLACCVEHADLQDDLNRTQGIWLRHSAELKDAVNAKDEEVWQLGAEVLHLREQLQSCASYRCGSRSKGSSVMLAPDRVGGTRIIESSWNLSL